MASLSIRDRILEQGSTMANQLKNSTQGRGRVSDAFCPIYVSLRLGPGYPMQTMNGTSSKNSKPFPADPKYILDECKAMDSKLDGFDKQLREMQDLQRNAISDPSQSQADNAPGGKLIAANRELMDGFRSLVEKIRWIKSDKRHLQPTYFSNVDRLERRLKQAIDEYKNYDKWARNEVRMTAARQYQTIYTDASIQEALEAVDDPANTQLFSQAVSRLRVHFSCCY